MDIVLCDKDYYRISGGGVTLSGGEPLLQADFCAELLRRCKQSGIHTAVETAGNVPLENFEKVLPYVDLFLFDIKAMSSERHIFCTGQNNETIINNARMLRQKKANILFRTPVVPQWNEDELPFLHDFVQGDRWELLKFHHIGTTKYQALRREDKTEGVQEMTDEQMTFLARKYNAEYHPSGI